MNKIIYSVDVEKDLHGSSYKGVKEGLVEFEKICDKNGILPVLFVTGECLKSNGGLFKRLAKKGWEISFHGFSHERFDDLTLSEKEREIKSSLALWKKVLGFNPRGFRAPQHSIDDTTLDLLEKYGFEYDSSYTPLNLLQLFFFPGRAKLWIKSFLSPLNEYRIRKNLVERPCSSLILPFVSLIVRILPVSLMRAYVKMLKLIYTKPMFYAHSWDFIKLRESRIDRAFTSQAFIRKLDKIMELE
ncbi:MAG: polysaccharide deacetylase family protein [archaeon]